eukprot:Awhi_evm1s4546
MKYYPTNKYKGNKNLDTIEDVTASSSEDLEVITFGDDWDHLRNLKKENNKKVYMAVYSYLTSRSP